MIPIHIQKGSFFNEETNEFIDIEPRVLHMEHSLYTISKWEEKWHKPYLSNLPSFKKTEEEALDYMRCMCLEDDEEEINPLIFNCMSKTEYDKLIKYVQDPHTATTVTKKDDKPPSRDIMTAEVIYYNMFSAQIPKECEHWHINKLLKLLEVFAAKQEKPKKMPKTAMVNQRRAVSRARGYH